jgi:hypothetical protein
MLRSNLHKLRTLLIAIAICRVKNTLLPITLIFKPSHPLKRILIFPKLSISSNPRSYFQYLGKGWRGRAATVYPSRWVSCRATNGAVGRGGTWGTWRGVRKRILIKHFRSWGLKTYVVWPVATLRFIASRCCEVAVHGSSSLLAVSSSTEPILR